MAIAINGSGTVTGISVGGLPDGIVDAGTLASNAVETAKINANAVTVAKASGSVKGIQEVDQWRINTNLTIGAGGTDLTSNWERNDSGFEVIGTGMSESSGIFTFPSTGKWVVDYRSMCHDTDPSRYGGIIIYFTTNNSSYNNIGESFGGIFDKSGDNVYAAFSAYAIVDVTNTSTHKCKFWVGAQNEALFNGASDGQRTGVTFTRLGDT